MQLRQLEIFHAIMLTGSVSAAAKHLRISQPAATRLLHRAEDLLGYKLFSRTKGRLTPTNEARILYGESQQVLGGLDHLRRLSANLGKSQAGHLRIAATHSLCYDALPLAIARLLKRNPKATFALEARLYDELIRVVTSREIDIAFGLNLSPRAGLEVTPLTRGRFYGIFPAADAARLPRQVDARVFRRYRFIGQISENPIWPFAGTSLDIARTRELNISPAIGVKTNQIALSLVQKGVGAAIVDQYTAAASNPEHVAVRPLSFDFTFSVDAIRPANEPVSYLVNRCIEAFVEADKEVARSIGSDAQA